MKIAYLILAHTHPLHLTRLIAALQTEQADILGSPSFGVIEDNRPIMSFNKLILVCDGVAVGR